MSWFKPRGLLDKTYEAGIILKGVDGLLELLGGLLLLVVSPREISSVISALTQHELAEDPRDFLAVHLMSSGQHLASGSASFAVAYLWIHGFTKVFLVAALLRNKLWAYPLSIFVLVLFVLYQIYRVSYSHSVGLILLTIFDLAVIWLIWREYGRQKTRPRA